MHPGSLEDPERLQCFEEFLEGYFEGLVDGDMALPKTEVMLI